MDAFNDRTIIVDEVEYNLIRNMIYEVDLSVSVNELQMDYNDNNVLYLDWAAKEGASIEGFEPETIYADLSQLGLGSKVEINKELKAFTFGCKDYIAPGEKTITVTIIDNCDNKYKAKTKVTVTERVKAENTETKLGDFDWDEAVIYFAITDRFFDGNETNNTATEGYDANDETDAGRYHGGDFAGLTQKIDYLYDLGVNTIWITPIVDNVDGDFITDDYEDETAEFYAYHGYWASDFRKLNPHLGNEEEFKALIDAAHAKGMKIMVDVVLNHAGYDSEDSFSSIISDGNGGYINMIRGEEETIPNDEKRDGLSGLPDFITENEAVRNQLIEWQTGWMKEYDIDYYRVDTVKHVEDTTWEAFKNALTESNPDFKLIGEYYGADYNNTAGQLNSGKMDSLLDFGFKYYAEDFVGGKISSVENNLAARNKGIDNTGTLGGFLSSHDEDGLLYKLQKKTDDEALALGQMMVAASLQFTSKGQPVIYYGEEIGQTGANDWPYYTNRYDFDWDSVTNENSLYNHYKKMLNIRREHSELFARGTRTFVAGADAEGYEVVRRTYDGKNIYVGLNVKEAEKTVTFKVTAAPGSTYTDKYSNETYTVSEEGKVTVTIPGIKEGGTVVLVLTTGDEVPVVDTNTISIKLHYYRADGEYVTDKGNWNVWMWSEGKGGAAYELVNEGTAENPDMVATCEVEGRSTNKVGFIVRKGDWKEQEGGDRFIDISDVVSGTVHVYVNSGETAFTRVLGEDAILGIKIVSAAYIRETNQVEVVTSQPILGSAETEFVIKCGTDEVIAITEAEVNECTYLLSIAEDLTALSELVKSYTITYDNYEYNLAMPNVYSSDEFEGKYTYTGNDLGAAWTKDSTTFKVWAPTAQNVQLALYKSGDPSAEDLIKTVNMTLGEKGVWSAKVDGDINGTYYTYRVSVDGKEKEACDPYATTTGVNGKRAMVINLDSTDPEGWAADKGPHTGMNYTDAVIYELHVRDASIDESSGVSAANKGKYLGLTETGTKTANGVSTVLDHIKNLGVTHVHLLPVYDYGSVDETKLDTPQFNWGYDPVNFNVPEGSYSTDPYNGEVRVKEFKQMVKTMHDNNLNVVMDVVYNHVYDAETYCFNQIVPKYFSRTNADGSYNGDTGCGNTTASERTMVQKYIVDSVLYWAQEYHIDGFRFDLVGLIDAETMDKVVKAVHAVDPDILFYGEGWSMSSGTTKGTIPMATQAEAKANLESGTLSDFAYFSDTFRDNLAGNNTNGQGFVLGYADKETVMKKCFSAATDWCPGPAYTVNYASCHDNYTLMDKLNEAAKDATEEERIKMNNLSAAFYMLSEGIPFIHAGEEFLRTKVAEDGEIIHNSYNSPDYVNKLRWYNLEDEKYSDVVEYYKGLIEFRKNHEALRLTTASDVAANVTSYTVDDSLLLFDVKGKDSVAGETSDGIVIIFNGNRTAKTVDLSAYDITGDWKVCINAENAGTDVIETVSGSVTVDAISALVLVQGDTEDTVPQTPQIPEGIIAITNIHTNLGDVDLPEGWTWMYPDIPVKAFAGQQTKTFQAYYGEDKNNIAEIPVSIISISKAEVAISTAVIEQAKAVTATVNLVTTGANIPENMMSVEWATSKEDVAAVTKSGALTADVTGVAKGSAAISAVVTISVGEKTATFNSNKVNVKVIDGKLANISFKDIPAEWAKMDEVDAYKTVYVKDQPFNVSVASTSTKVTIKSSDAKIVKVGAVAKNEAGDFTTTLTIKKAGYVKLTAIANDELKSQTSIELYVKDATPNVSSTKVELNNKSEAASSVFVYPNEDYTIETVSIDNEYFAVKNVAGTNEYAISLAEVMGEDGQLHKAGKGSYKQNLVIKVAGVDEAYKVPFAVKVVSKNPTAKIKQTRKVNLYYNDATANGILSISSTDCITKVTLTDCGYEYDQATGQISVSKKEGADNADKKGVLTISFAGFAQPVTKNITIATENRKPVVKLGAKSGVVYPKAGIKATEVTLQDVTTGKEIKADEISVSFKNDIGKDAYEVVAADNKVTFTLKDETFASKAKATISVTKANSVEQKVIPLTYALTVNRNEPAVALDKKAVTLNMNSAVSEYEHVVLKASVKEAPLGEVKTLVVDGANSKAKAELGKSIIVTPENNTLVVSLGEVKDLKTGSYKFNVVGKNGETTYKAATFTVKIVNQTPEKTVKLSKSGNIDVLNRDTTSIVYSPKLTNITGTVTDVALTGRSSHLFKAELVDGKIQLSVRGNDIDAQNAVRLITKYNYGVAFKLTLSNGFNTYVVDTGLQQFKLTQSKPKVTVVPKQTIMYNTVNKNMVSVAFNAANKDGSAVTIDRVELINFNNAFAYDKETNTLALTGRGEVVKGKTYSLKFNVYCDGYADNEKPVTVTYKVKVN